MEWIIVVMVCVIATVSAHLNGHDLPQGNILKDRNHVQDQQHIMEHLDGVYKKPQEQMTDQELKFHYFKLHDYDNNNMLDGIELVSAITHFHKEDHEDEEEHEERAAPKLPETQLISMIDTILTEEDENKDGYISYVEFMKAQKEDDQS